jgi:hypothetical protein
MKTKDRGRKVGDTMMDGEQKNHMYLSFIIFLSHEYVLCVLVQN